MWYTFSWLFNLTTAKSPDWIAFVRMQLKRIQGALVLLDDKWCVVQLDSRIESLTARQRERPPTVDRPRMPAGPERFLQATSAQGTP